MIDVKIFISSRSVKMKKNYELAKIEFILIDQCDIITASTSEPGPITGNGPIGGGGYDPDGWT